MKQFLFSTVLVFISILGFAQTVTTVDSIAVKQKNDTVPDDSPVFTYAEVMPVFPGEAGSFQQYLAANIKYPKDEQLKKIQGTVYVNFVVEKDGSISSVRIVKEVPGAPGFSAEAIRVVSAMPKWSPGMMNGRAVRVDITQPIRFML